MDDISKSICDTLRVNVTELANLYVHFSHIGDMCDNEMETSTGLERWMRLNVTVLLRWMPN